ncbi:YitT family protein [Thermicanus aegyptius]|uniref:YitT family protein n=1 Tax=Thermicanus aegyptius TaxID=94009 RepID=UPI0006851B55|nr:YitT family protein [Thermicanus aegyptius]
MTIGAAIFSFGINYFNIANGLAEGGFTGIALLFYALFHFPPGWFTFLSNIPLFIIGWRYLGHLSMMYTIYSTTAVSFFLELFKRFQEPTSDLFLASLYAGVFAGVGLGIIFRYGGTTGGVDIIARLVHKFRGISMGRTMFLFDAMVIGLSLLTYLDRERAMYTLVAVYIASRVIDFVQEGFYAAKEAIIISEKAKEISATIIKELERGVTLLEGKGGYTGTDREVLLCVVGRNELIRLKTLIHQIDPHAFVVVSDAYDVLGEGFTLDANKNPLQEHFHP